MTGVCNAQPRVEAVAGRLPEEPRPVGLACVEQSHADGRREGKNQDGGERRRDRSQEPHWTSDDGQNGSRRRQMTTTVGVLQETLYQALRVTLCDAWHVEGCGRCHESTGALPHCLTRSWLQSTTFRIPAVSRTVFVDSLWYFPHAYCQHRWYSGRRWHSPPGRTLALLFLKVIFGDGGSTWDLTAELATASSCFVHSRFPPPPPQQGTRF